MITEKQRRRALARAKWERQRARRSASQRRARMWSIIGGAAASVVLVVFVGWGVVHLVTTDDSNSPSQQLPSDFPTFKTPTNTGFTTIYSPPTTGSTGSITKPTSTSTRPTTASPVPSGSTR